MKKIKFYSYTPVRLKVSELAQNFDNNQTVEKCDGYKSAIHVMTPLNYIY